MQRVVFVLLAVLLAVSSASRLCLHDTATLTLVDTSQENSFCTHEDGCLVEWSIEVDTDQLDPVSETAQRPRWPISILVGPQKTPITTIYPELDDVDVMCSPTGDIIMTTQTTANNERLRFIWSYDTTGAYSCMELFSHLDPASGFRNFQALFAFDGSIMFNAAFSSRDSFHSLYHQQVECPTSSPVQPHGGEPMRPSPSAAPVSQMDHACANNIPCTYDSTYWSKQEDSPTYLALASERVCGVTNEDIFEKKGDYIKLKPNIASQARRLFVQKLTVASYGCHYPQGQESFEAFESLNRYLSDPVNCNSDVYHQDWMDTLSSYEQGRLEIPNCKDMVGGKIGKASNHTSPCASCEDKRDIYLYWAIAATVLAGILLCAFAIVLVFLLAYVCADPRYGGGRRAFARISSAIRDESDDEEDGEEMMGQEMEARQEKPKKRKKKAKRVSAPRSSSPPLRQTVHSDDDDDDIDYDGLVF